MIAFSRTDYSERLSLNAAARAAVSPAREWMQSGRRFTRQAFPSTPMPRLVPGPIPRRYGWALRFAALNAKVDLWV